jgi:glucan phosphoethanolaminetransferase (alkaline phosphatase superfamily)
MLGNKNRQNKGDDSVSNRLGEVVHPVTKTALLAFVAVSYIVNLLYMWKIYRPEDAWLPLTKIPPSTAFVATTALVFLVFMFVKRLDVLETKK